MKHFYIEVLLLEKLEFIFSSQCTRCQCENCETLWKTLLYHINPQLVTDFTEAS